MKIIGATGKAGSGKSSLLEGIATEMEFTHTSEIHSFADPIKDALNSMFGWRREFWLDREWKERSIPDLEYQLAADDGVPANAIGEYRGNSPRRLAQTLGTEWGRGTVHPDIWLIIAKVKLKRFKEAPHVSPKIFMIADVRFENEAAWIRQEGGILVEVVRGSPDIDEAAHSSETGVPDKYITHSLINDGTIDEMIVKGILLCGL